MKLCLLLRSLAKRIGAKIDFFALIVHPDDAVAIFSDLQLLEVLRLLQVGEDFAARDDRPQVDDSCIAVIPLDFQHTMDDRLGRGDTGYLLHSMLPGFPPALHTSQAFCNAWRRAVAHC